jgi:hypothetical protein
VVKGKPVDPKEVQLPHLWWLDLSFRGGVAKRVGWWVEDVTCWRHQFMIVFRDGTKSPVMWGTNPDREKE